MTNITHHFIPDRLEYTGAQLHSHWAYRAFDLLGDSIVSFIGPCDVKPEFMKDVEDLKAGSRIYSEEMLHFIVEHFDTDLDRMILRQRMLMAVMAETLNVRLGRSAIVRKGSDLYDADAKLTVSIASISPVSALIHAGINISCHNTPVKTRGLNDYKIAPREFAEAIMAGYVAECASVRKARCKVRGCE